MKEFLMNPWTVTVCGGILVGFFSIIFFSKNKVTQSNKGVIGIDIQSGSQGEIENVAFMVEGDNATGMRVSGGSKVTMSNSDFEIKN